MKKILGIILLAILMLSSLAIFVIAYQLDINSPPSITKTNPVVFNVTSNTTDREIIINTSLYGNFTGTWALNETVNTPNSIYSGENWTTSCSASGSDFNTDCVTLTINGYVNHTIANAQDGTCASLRAYINYTNGTGTENVGVTFDALANKTIYNPNPYEKVNFIRFNLYRLGSSGCGSSSFTVNGLYVNLLNYKTNYTQNFSKTLTDGSYLYAFESCNNEGTCNLTSNQTLIFDSTKPNVSIISPNTTVSSGTISINFSATDTNNISSCYYNLTRGESIEKSNTFLTSSTSYYNDTYALSGEATYVLNTWCNDTANNFNASNLTLIYTAPSGGGSPSGGGGGGGTVIVGASGWEMTTAEGVASYDIAMPLGTSRTLGINFENMGSSARTITLSCSDVKGSACRLVSFDETTFNLPVLKDVKTRKTFTLTLPEDLSSGEYTFNIIATDDSGNPLSISVYLSAGTEDLILATLSKLGLSTKSGFPYMLIFLPTLIILIVGLAKAFPKTTPAKPLWVFLISGAVSLAVIYFV